MRTTSQRAVPHPVCRSPPDRMNLCGAGGEELTWGGSWAGSREWMERGGRGVGIGSRETTGGAILMGRSVREQ